MKAPKPAQQAFVQTPEPIYKITEPSAARIAVAIAASPYSPSTAVMDILDNSVENGAKGVNVLFVTEGKQITRIIFADDGNSAPSRRDCGRNAACRQSHAPSL